MNRFNIDKYLEFLEKVQCNLKKCITVIANEKSVDGAIIGTGRSDYTQDVTGYTLYKNNKPFVLYDVPGIEGNEAAYEEIIHKAVNKAHIVFYVNSNTKKIEPKTAEKIKKYLRNDTDVYSVINVHLPPKAKRVPEIDGTYQDELKAAYQKDEKTIKKQTEETLQAILGNNFKSGILVNGLLAFSANAFDINLGFSTIISDTEDKNLCSNQKKFMLEYTNNFDQMKQESNIAKITKIIDEHADNFHEFIIESNKKKLITRLNDAYEKISNLKNDSIKFCGKVIGSYNEIKDSVSNAENHFVAFLRRGYIEDSVQEVITYELEELYNLIEKKEGKLRKEDYETFFEGKRKIIETSINKQLEENYKEAYGDFESALEEAKNRFGKDISNLAKFASIQFPSIQKMDFNKITMEMKFSGKDFGEATLKIGSLALSGFFVGSLFPGIGNIIGAITGAITGVLFVIADFFTSKAKRIAKTKERAKEQYDELSISLIEQLEEVFPFEKYEKDIRDIASSIQLSCDSEIAKFEILEKTFNKLVKFIYTKKTKLMELKYGTL